MSAKDRILEFFVSKYPDWFYAMEVSDLSGVSPGRTYEHIKELFKEGKLRIKSGKKSATRQTMTLYQANIPEEKKSE